MKLLGKRLQVWHYPQLPCEPFKIDVKDEHEAIKIIEIIGDQHIWLYKNKMIPDYCNSFAVMMWEEELGINEWVEYWNDEEKLNWQDFEAVFENEIISSID